MKLSKLATGELYKELSRKQAGFAIEGELLRKLQLVYVHMVQDIEGVCEECGIPYFLVGGNCLGAVRHHGPIPWDDDMDIGFLSKDLEPFLKAFQEKFSEKYEIYDINTKGHCSVIDYISLRGSVQRELSDEEGKTSGISVSLDRIYNVPNNRALRAFHGFLCDGFALLLSCRNIYENRKNFLALCEGFPEAQKIYKIKIAIGWCTKLLTVRGLTKLTENIRELCKNEQSKYVSIMGRAHYFGDMYPRSWFLPPVKTEYAGYMLNIPAQANRYLAKLYGEDYMTIPPEEKREKHACRELKLPTWADEL